MITILHFKPEILTFKHRCRRIIYLIAATFLARRLDNNYWPVDRNPVQAWRSGDNHMSGTPQQASSKHLHKQRVLMHGHQGWNVRHGLCHIYMIYVYIWVVYSFCLFCCLFIIVTTQFVALYKPCKPKPKPSTYDPPDNHPLAEIQRRILRPEPKQQICHQHANTDHFGK